MLNNMTKTFAHHIMPPALELKQCNSWFDTYASCDNARLDATSQAKFLYTPQARYQMHSTSRILPIGTCKSFRDYAPYALRIPVNRPMYAAH